MGITNEKHHKKNRFEWFTISSLRLRQRYLTCSVLIMFLLEWCFQVFLPPAAYFF